MHVMVRLAQQRLESLRSHRKMCEGQIAALQSEMDHWTRDRDACVQDIVAIEDWLCLINTLSSMSTSNTAANSGT